MYVERLLLHRAQGRPGITVRLGWQVTEVGQYPDGAWVRAEQASDGAAARWRAAYVVGCDGAQSVVRAAIGARYAGSGGIDQDILGRRACAAHLRLPTLYRRFLAGRRAWSYWAMTWELAVNLIALNGRDEFFLLTSSVDPDQPAGQLTALITDLVCRAAGERIPVQVLGIRAWTPGLALVADRFVDRRLLIAGDAAHLFTPTGGFGMNTGIDDAANLAWKIAASLVGWGGTGLLGSYERERRPVAERNTAAARQLNKNLARIQLDGVLEEDSSAGAAERARIGDLLAGYGEQFASIGVQLGARYDGSPVICPDGDPPPDSPVSYTPTSVPGGRAPHAWRGRSRGPGDSLFDRLGARFTLLRLGPRAPDAARLRAAAGPVPLAVLTVDSPAVRDLYERDLVLIRPDQHVAGRGNRIPHDPGRLCALVTGALQPVLPGA
jgi:2-polyprenyl-6-methoxyphenol hydroxylase-like FAD-dependent oxidoreductase